MSEAPRVLFVAPPLHFDWAGSYSRSLTSWPVLLQCMSGQLISSQHTIVSAIPLCPGTACSQGPSLFQIQLQPSSHGNPGTTCTWYSPCPVSASLQDLAWLASGISCGQTHSRSIYNLLAKEASPSLPFSTVFLHPTPTSAATPAHLPKIRSTPSLPGKAT